MRRAAAAQESAARPRTANGAIVERKGRPGHAATVGPSVPPALQRARRLWKRAISVAGTSCGCLQLYYKLTAPPPQLVAHATQARWPWPARTPGPKAEALPPCRLEVPAMLVQLWRQAGSIIGNACRRSRI